MPSRNGEAYDPRDRFGLYRLCDCTTCEGSGKGDEWMNTRCPDCRGEGRVRQEVASCESPESVGVALVTLAREGEWTECAFGLLDREGETNQKWLVLPWLPSARNVRDAQRGRWREAVSVLIGRYTRMTQGTAYQTLSILTTTPSMLTYGTTGRANDPRYERLPVLPPRTPEYGRGAPGGRRRTRGQRGAQ